ncbi:formate dehydrogenase accessory protein FdhE [uncultured Oxalicibacterium sp.]|uniref:formate dehydrogenase accessory protein FdhE n=1 Tax=uncultured Oxalicibacterium sp. TaxID=1168540 RepID=UPI0025D194D9|nr:formate dehydrogenase accessory protein FdhE [uncultured Oxalicibacterium sp.]
MTISQASRLLSPEEIAVRAGQQVEFLRLPQVADVFSARERRLRQCAHENAMRDFLLFAADIAHAQHVALQSFPAVRLPDFDAINAAAHAGKPALAATSWERDPQWITALRNMLESMLPTLQTQDAVGAAIRKVLALSDQEIEQQADRLLNNIMFGLDLASAPLIAAGLQVYWVHMVSAVQQAHGEDRLAPFGRTDDPSRCPCCGSLPTASISRIDADGSYRYVHCSLCSAQWHVVRIKCTHCDSTKGIQYQSLQASDDESVGTVRKEAVEAETCDECGHYLKILRMERNPAVEPVADDLASLTLDLLVSEAGFQRHGINLMLLFGDPDAQEPDPGSTH